MYKVKFSSYCGMSSFPDHFELREDARSHAAFLILRARQDFKVTTITRGEHWEVLEPENAVMVPDQCGSLYIEHITYACRECGSRCETGEDATLCCVEEDSSADDYHESIGNANWGIDSH